MRARRIRFFDRPAVYHLISRTVAGEHLLERPDQEVLRNQIRQMAAFCGIEVLTYCILSNHFHLLVCAPPKQDLPDEELVRRFAVLYGQDRAQVLEENLRSSPNANRIREGLLNRMHDVSFFMKELKMRFTIYFNKTHSRFGTLWAERFKSLLVESKGHRNAVLAVAAYIDLNPVRAGLCGDPKDYRFCGYAEALAGGSEAREGLGWLIDRSKWRDVLEEYRMVLFGTGALSDRSREGGIDANTSQEVLSVRGKLPARELLLSRVRYFSDGLAIGSARFVRSAREKVLGKGSRPFRMPQMPKTDAQDLFFARRQKSTPSR